MIMNENKVDQIIFGNFTKNKKKKKKNLNFWTNTFSP